MSLIDSGRMRQAAPTGKPRCATNPLRPLHFNLAAICEAPGDRRAARRHYTAAHDRAPKGERYTSEIRLFTRRQ